MPVEIEAKMRITGHAAIRARLKKIGATHIGRYLERNAFFDTPDHSLLDGDRGLRLRTKHDPETRRNTHIVTFKGPRKAGALKRREEIETKVADRDATIRLFDRLGYEMTLVFDKRRESWELDSCKIELDEVPLLGTYVEIEGPDEETVMSVREKLGMANFKLISDSYIGMLQAHLKKHRSKKRIVTF